MDKRPLGRSPLRVAPLAFGGNVFGWSADEATSFSLLDAFVDAGFDLVDTADVYSRWVRGHAGGESETVIGKWLKKTGRRDEVVLATKVGGDMGQSEPGLSKRHILKSIDASLKRLQTDHVDLYQSHRDDPDTAFEETLETYARLIEVGKVRAIGASNFTAARLAAALDVSERDGLPRYESLQPHYNLVARGVYEQELEPLCVERGLGVINYYGLASGFLSGKYRSEADLSKSKARGEGVRKHLNARGSRGTRRARRGRGALRHATGDRRAGVADRAPVDHRADRERDVDGAVAGVARGRDTAARRRRDRTTRPRERRKLTRPRRPA